jgi:hypothetical protein
VRHEGIKNGVLARLTLPYPLSIYRLNELAVTSGNNKNDYKSSNRSTENYSTLITTTETFSNMENT